MSLVGQQIDHYRILRLLGRGGMGEVYAGFDVTLERSVALKVIHTERRLDERSRTRFLREARVLSLLDHPGICRIYDYVRGDDQDLLVLELIEGRSLGEAIRDGLDRGHALAIAQDIADVLVAAHAAGVVHRDLKPDNAILTPAGRPKVLDFGLARTAADVSTPEAGARPAVDGPGSADVSETATFGLTEAGSITGTPMYMSPEQASGEPATAASDMYSFGLLLQTLFTGEHPYRRAETPAALLEMVRQADTQPVRGVDAHLTALIDRLKSRAPGARPTSSETAQRLLWIRNKTRRRLRNAAIAGALILVALATLKYTVDLRHARDIAETRRDQAESLSEFMLFDLRERLEPIGRLDLLDDVGAKAMEYFASIPPGDLTEDELFRHSRALTQIGEVRSARGDLAEALRAFGQSLELAEELAQRDPQDRDRQLGLGASHFWVGYVAWRQGRLDDAAASFEVYRGIAERLVERYPQDPEVRLELGYAYSNLGQVLEARGDLEAALGHYRRCLEVEQEQAESDPDNTDLLVDVANSHNTIGNVLAWLGRLHEARESYEADLQIKRRLTAVDPDNMIWRHYLAVSHNLVGNILGDLGRSREALEHLDQATAIGEELVQRDPTNAEWRRDLAIDLRVRAKLMYQLGTGPTIEDLERTVRMFRELQAKSASDPRLGQELASALVALGHRLDEDKRRAEAEHYVREATGIIDPLVEQHPDNRGHCLVAAAAHERLGVILANAKRETEARAAWDTALSRIGNVAQDTTDPRILAQQGRLLVRLDRIGEARPVAERMSRTGYADPATLALFEDRSVLP